MLCGDPQHWVSACPLIPEESRRVATQRKAAIVSSPVRRPMAALGAVPGKHSTPAGVKAIEEEHPQPNSSDEVTYPGEENE